MIDIPSPKGAEQDADPARAYEKPPPRRPKGAVVATGFLAAIALYFKAFLGRRAEAAPAEAPEPPGDGGAAGGAGAALPHGGRARPCPPSRRRTRSLPSRTSSSAPSPTPCPISTRPRRTGPRCSGRARS